MYSIALTFKTEVSIVVGGSTDCAVATSLAFLIVQIDVVECRTFNSCFMKQATIAFVVEERSAKLADKNKDALSRFGKLCQRQTSRIILLSSNPLHGRSPKR